VITVTYLVGQGSSQTNTSSRISQVQDSLTTYIWGYQTQNGTWPPHISLVIHAANGQGFIDAGFSYTRANTVSPFTVPLPGQPLAVRLLGAITFTGAPGQGGYGFTYNSNGEVTAISFPHRGYFRYSYAVDNLAYPTRQTRVIANRYVSTEGTSGSEQAYWFQFQGGDNNQPSHSQFKLWDASGNEKIWYFLHSSSNGWDNGLEYQMDTLSYDGQTTPVRRTQTSWTQDNPGAQTLTNPRVSSVTTTLEDGQTQSMVQQDTDANGNVTAVREYAFGNLSTPYRTTTKTYLADPAYTSVNILNRPTEVKVCAGAAPCSGSNVASDTFVSYDTNASMGQAGWATAAVLVNDANSQNFRDCLCAEHFRPMATGHGDLHGDIHGAPRHCPAIWGRFRHGLLRRCPGGAAIAGLCADAELCRQPLQCQRSQGIAAILHYAGKGHGELRLLGQWSVVQQDRRQEPDLDVPLRLQSPPDANPHGRHGPVQFYVR
jgi:hypothetical protein